MRYGPMEELEDLLEKYDGTATFVVASQCAWSGEVRFTLTNPDGCPSRSVCFYATGGQGPYDLTVKLLDDITAWLKDSGVTPLSPEDVYAHVE